MFNRLFNNQKALYFFAGAASATLGVRLLKSDAGRKLCVKGIAHGMRIQKDAAETFQNMKEEAADLCFDARNQPGDAE